MTNTALPASRESRAGPVVERGLDRSKPFCYLYRPLSARNTRSASRARRSFMAKQQRPQPRPNKAQTSSSSAPPARPASGVSGVGGGDHLEGIPSGSQVSQAPPQRRSTSFEAV